MFEGVRGELDRAIITRRWLRRLGLRPSGELVETSGFGLRLFLDASDYRGPSYHALKWGAASYERANARLLAELIRARATDGAHPLLVDVGANVGLLTFATLSAVPEARAVCFEPEPVSYRALMATIAANPALAKRVQVIELGLSDSEGQASFFIDSQNKGGHSIHAQSLASEGRAPERQLTINLSTLDAQTAALGLERLDVLKIDVQLNELPVLRGARQTLARFRPAILMECYYHQLTPEGLPSELARYGYNARIVSLPGAPGAAPSSLISLEELQAFAARQQAQDANGYVDVLFQVD